MQNLNQRAPEGPAAFLECRTGDLPLCVQILDASLAPQTAPVIGDLRVELPLGVYVVQFSLGDVVEELPTALTQPGATVEVCSRREWSPCTPIPLPGQEQAARLSAQLLAQQSRRSTHAGQGQLLLILQDTQKDALDWLEGLTFETAGGAPVADFAARDHRASDETRFLDWGGPPGTYALVSDPKATEYATVMPVPILAGWQTLVFLQPRKYGDSCYAPDLPRATVTMVRSRAGFVPGERSMLRTEAARIAMRLGANRPQVDTAWVGEQFSNPLLSCFAAHLLLNSTRPASRFVAQELARLLDAVGWMPDLQALMWGLRLADEHHEVPGDMWRQLERQGPVQAAPLIHAACGLLLGAHRQFGNVITSGLAEALEDTRLVSSDWAVRKRLPHPVGHVAVPAPQPSAVLPRYADALMHVAGLAFVEPSGFVSAARRLLGPIGKTSLPIKPGALGLAGTAVPRVERILEAIVKRLHTMDPALLNTLADRLRPFEREMIEAIYPLINPLNRSVPKEQSARSGAELLEALRAGLQSWAKRSRQAPSEQGIRSELLLAIRNIAREAKTLDQQRRTP